MQRKCCLVPYCVAFKISWIISTSVLSFSLLEWLYDGGDDTRLFLQIKGNAAFYLAHHNNIVPHSSRAIHPNWLDFGRGQEDAGGASLSEHGHASEQVGCRAEQGELDLHGHCPPAQPANWMQEPQFGHSIRPVSRDIRVHTTGNHFSRDQIWKTSNNSLHRACLYVSHFVLPKPAVALGPE